MNVKTKKIINVNDTYSYVVFEYEEKYYDRVAKEHYKIVEVIDVQKKLLYIVKQKNNKKVDIKIKTISENEINDLYLNDKQSEQIKVNKSIFYDSDVIKNLQIFVKNDVVVFTFK